MSDPNKINIEFAPGAFDDFAGSPEELDELIANVKRMIQDGSFIKNSVPLDSYPDDFKEEVLKKINDGPKDHN